MSSPEEDEDDDDIVSYKSVKESDEPKTDNTHKKRPQSCETTVNDKERQELRKNGRENRAKNQLEVNKINTGKIAKINEMERTVNEIYIKNEILEEIKAEIKKCTNSEVMKILKQFYDREYNRLQTLIIKAIILQNSMTTTSQRSWAEIPIATRLEEDTMTLNNENIRHTARVQLLKNSQQKKEIKDAREQKVMQKVLKIQANSSSESITIYTSSEDSAHSKLRLHLQNEESSSNTGGKKLNSRVNNIENELSCHNIKCENIFHVQPINSISRFSFIKDIENKIAILSNKKKILMQSSSPQMRTTALYRSKLKRLEDEILKLKEKTGYNLSNGKEKCQRNLSINEKKISSPFLEEYRHDSNAELLRTVTSASHENTLSRNMEKVDDNFDDKSFKDKINETDELKHKYVNILLQYEKLVAEQKDLIRSCDNNRSSDIKNENSPFFKNKPNDFLEEQQEFKYILNEQEIQLEEYQDKYMNAQQRIDELQNIIEQLETSNIKIDTQLHAEIAKIQCKFQKKIAELSAFPKLLQDEQHKLAKCSQENEDLIRKLCIVCNELKIMKERVLQVSTEAAAQSSLFDTEKIKQELKIAQQAAYLAEKDRGMLTEELLNVTDQFNTLRSKSAAILARNQERTEKQKDNLKIRIDQLEKQLAFARAQISRTIIDRDEKIKEIEAKLEAILCKYDVAVAENKTLKNHINYLTDQLAFHQIASSSVKGKENNNVRF